MTDEEEATTTARRERFFYGATIVVLLVTVGLLLPASLNYFKLRSYAVAHPCDPHVWWLREQLPRLNNHLPKPGCPGTIGP